MEGMMVVQIQEEAGSDALGQFRLPLSLDTFPR